jgi:hypothetical protein
VIFKTLDGISLRRGITVFFRPSFGRKLTAARDWLKELDANYGPAGQISHWEPHDRSCHPFTYPTSLLERRGYVAYRSSPAIQKRILNDEQVALIGRALSGMTQSIFLLWHSKM